MSVYAIPSLLALLIKTWLFWFGRRSLLDYNISLGFFLVALFCLNLAEFNLFFYVDKPEQAMGWMLFYWLSAILAVSSFVYLSGQLSGYPISLRHIMPLTFIMLFILYSTNLFVAGTEAISYSVTRIKGDYYNFLQIYILVHLFIGLSLLGYAGFRHKDKWIRKKCSIIFIAMLPTVVAVATVLFLMQIGIHVNATGIVSLTVVFFLVAIIFTETKYSLLNLLVIAPLSRESRYLKQILSPAVNFLFFIYNGKKIRLKDQLKQIEMVLIMTALEENQGDKHATAAQLGISKPGLDVKLREAKKILG